MVYASKKQKNPISGQVLLAKVDAFAAELELQRLSCTRSWIKRFAIRHSLSLTKISGDAGSLDLEVTDNWIKNHWPNISREYSEKDIFNGDETGLFLEL